MVMIVSESAIMYVLGALIVNVLAIGGIYALATSALTILFGGLGCPNASLGQFFILGSYLLLFFSTHFGLGFFEGMIASLAAMSLAYYLMERILMRRYYDLPREEKITLYLLVTIGMSLILSNLIVMIWYSDIYTVFTPWYYERIYVLGFPSRASTILGIILLFSALSAILLFLRYTRHGKAIRALVQDREMTSLMGVDITRLSTITFILACGCATYAGVVYAIIYAFDPTAISIIFSMTFTMVIVGGRGSILGAILMGLLYGLSQAVLTMFFFPSAGLYFFFIIMFITLLIKPEGLFRR